MKEAVVLPVAEVPGSQVLRKTLSTLGYDLDQHPEGRVEILTYADPDLPDIGIAYGSVNKLLGEMVARRQLSGVSHITGEARALVDAAHRTLLREHAAAGCESRLACFLGDMKAPTALDFVQYELQHWGADLEWYDIVDILSLAATGALTLHVLPAQEPVHFSLFGPDLVLMQAQHVHPSPEKYVWFLRSGGMHDYLKTGVEARFADAFKISQGSFDRVLDDLYCFEVVQVGRWCAGDRSDSDVGSQIDNATRMRGLSLLTALGFLEGDEGRPRLSRSGRGWLRSALA